MRKSRENVSGMLSSQTASARDQDQTRQAMTHNCTQAKPRLRPVGKNLQLDNGPRPLDKPQTWNYRTLEIVFYWHLHFIHTVASWSSHIGCLSSLYHTTIKHCASRCLQFDCTGSLRKHGTVSLWQPCSSVIFTSCLSHFLFPQLCVATLSNTIYAEAGRRKHPQLSISILLQKQCTFIRDSSKMLFQTNKWLMTANKRKLLRSLVYWI